MKVHQLKVDFNVTENIKRFVYVYIIEAEHCYMIDSGVSAVKSRLLPILKTSDGSRLMSKAYS